MRIFVTRVRRGQFLVTYTSNGPYHCMRVENDVHSIQTRYIPRSYACEIDLDRYFGLVTGQWIIGKDGRIVLTEERDIYE